MKKIILLMLMLITSFMGVGMLKVNAQTTSAKAIWCGEEGVTTLYFLYDNVTYSQDDTYHDHLISKVFETPGSARYDSDIKTLCTTVVIEESFQNARYVNCDYMFSGLTALTSVTGLRYMITESTQRTNSMFSSCSKLATIDFTGVNTSNVFKMSYMFYECSALSSLNLGNFDTSKVTDMNNMFYHCSGLTSLDLSSFDTGEVNL